MGRRLAVEPGRRWRIVITWRHGARFDGLSWALFVFTGLLTIYAALERQPAFAAFGAGCLGLCFGIALGTRSPCSCGHNSEHYDGGGENGR